MQDAEWYKDRRERAKSDMKGRNEVKEKGERTVTIAEMMTMMTSAIAAMMALIPLVRFSTNSQIHSRVTPKFQLRRMRVDENMSKSIAAARIEAIG